jgi:SOS-response transcriptional repressor LexA
MNFRRDMFMDYFDYLSNMIDKSGLTLKELSDKCGDLGVKVAPSYISKLQTRSQNPASDDINKAIAQVCNADVENLLYESYIAKAPEMIKDLQKGTSKWFRDYLINLTKETYPNELVPLIFEEQQQLTDYHLVKHVLETTKNFNELDFNDEEINGYEFSITDDSMEPQIPVGSKLIFERNVPIKSGDIVVAIFDKSVLIRRLLIYNDLYILIANKYSIEPIITNEEKLQLLGRAKEITLNIPL